MSGHVVDRLSAYLDGELTVADAALVRQHLGACGPCAEELALLAAVDSRLRQVSVEAPKGYFDSFSARVRGRIEAAAPSRRTFSLPTWSWAVAAALLLAVVLPRLPWDEAPRPEPAPATLPYPGPASAAVPERAAAPVPTPEPEAGFDAAKPQKAEADKDQVAPSDLSLQDQKRRLAPEFARAPVAPAAPPAAGAEAKLAAERAAAELDAGLSSREASVDRMEARPAPAEDAEALREDRLGKAEGGYAEPPKADAPVPAGPGLVAQGQSAEKQNAEPRGTGGALKRARDPATAEFEVLRSRKASSLEEVRGQREALRSFVKRHPASAEAAEARVLIVSLGVDIAERTGRAKDAEEARRDGADALAHGDMRQQQRVQTLLGQQRPE